MVELLFSPTARLCYGGFRGDAVGVEEDGVQALRGGACRGLSALGL